jgi:hypothetical protein
MLKALVLALAFFGAAAYAQTPVTTLRGAIASVTGDAVTMTSRSGETVTVRLSPETRLVAVVAASAADLKPDSFIGVAAVPEGDGLKALEVHVFPEAMRGTGEGFRPFDLAPGSTMTNGALQARVGGVDGDRLTVTYKGGSQTVRLPKETPIVAFAPGERADLKPGAAAIARGPKGPDSAIDAAALLVGRDGLTPPM